MENNKTMLFTTKMVGCGRTIEGLPYATHFERRNTNFFAVESYNITQQSSTFDGKQQNNDVSPPIMIV